MNVLGILVGLSISLLGFVPVEAAQARSTHKASGNRAANSGAGRTRVSIVGGRWHLNGAVTYPGARAEGLLMNARMVNAVFEDAGRADFDPEANADEFIRHISDYVRHGVRAFTISLQGGMPGYEGAVNSAFNPDGSLRGKYMARVRRVIEACDRHGAAVILSCYYQRQDQVLKNEAAVRAGVVNTARWIRAHRFTNVVLEVANEFPIKGFDHPLLKTAEGQVELMRLVRQAAPGLLVSSSGYGDGLLADEVARASDFLLPHFNSVPVEAIASKIAALKKYGKPVVCNEDDKVGERGARAAEVSVANGASWGLMLRELNQRYPFTSWGTLNAVDLNTGEIRWRVPLGSVEELEARGLPPTGTPNLGGSIVTAGGLVFIGGSNDRRFRAFDAASGEVLWTGELEGSGHATPITYEGRRTKRQYVVIAAGGGGYLSRHSADALAAFALPDRADDEGQ